MLWVVWWILAGGNFGCAALDYWGRDWPLFFINAALGFWFSYVALEARDGSRDL